MSEKPKNLQSLALKYAIIVAVTVSAGGKPAAAEEPLGTPFIYEGQLIVRGSPATGSLDVESWLFDAAVGGAQIGPTVVNVVFAEDNRRFTLGHDSGEDSDVIHFRVSP